MQNKVSIKYKELRKPVQYNHISSPFGTVGTLQADLMDLSKFSHKKKGFKYILNAIDVFSRYSWGTPLKSKNAKDVSEGINEIFQDLKETHPDVMLTLTTDNGKEFINSSVKKVLEKNDVWKHYLNDPEKVTQHSRMGKIERFNGTLLNRIKKLMYTNDSIKYVDDIPDLVFNYNNTIHSTIGEKPIDVYENKAIPDDVEQVEMNQVVVLT